MYYNNLLAVNTTGDNGGGTTRDGRLLGVLALLILLVFLVLLLVFILNFDLLPFTVISLFVSPFFVTDDFTFELEFTDGVALLLSGDLTFLFTVILPFGVLLLADYTVADLSVSSGGFVVGVVRVAG